MKNILNAINSSMGSIISIVLLIISIATGLISLKADSTSVLLFLIPVLALVIVNLPWFKGFIVKCLVFYKSFVSSRSMVWEVIGEVTSDVEITRDNITSCLHTDNYNIIKRDVVKDEHIIMNMDGMRFEFKVTNEGDYFGYLFSFSADSSPRSYKQKHEKYVILPFFRDIESFCGDKQTIRKYSVNAMKALIFQESVDSSFCVSWGNNLEPIKVKATYKSKTDNTLVNIDNKKFNCVSDNFSSCLLSFNEYILVL